MVLRWGGTVSYANRYISLAPGPAGGPALADGGDFPTKDFTVPLEFDKLIATFTPPVRSDLKRFLAKSGVALETAAPSLRRALQRLPGALEQTAPAVQDLADETRTLETLVRSTDAVVNAAHRADPGAGRLVSGAATTLKAVAQNAAGVQQTLDRVPTTLARARNTMRRADHTLRLAARVTGRLAPGVEEARRLAAPLNGVLGRLEQVGPDARATLSTARKASPDLNSLLGRLRTDAPLIESTGRQAIPQVDCIRPYTPDIVNLFTTWSDFMGQNDGKDHFFRMVPKVLVPTPYNANPMTSGQLQRLNPDMQYAFPIPPGHLAGQPWFQPQCGIGPEVYDADKDPESRQRYDRVDPIATDQGPGR
jgi:ABC-type transporter Mla subunit MlaD